MRKIDFTYHNSIIYNSRSKNHAKSISNTRKLKACCINVAEFMSNFIKIVNHIKNGVNNLK